MGILRSGKPLARMLIGARFTAATGVPNKVDRSKIPEFDPKKNKHSLQNKH